MEMKERNNSKKEEGDGNPKNGAVQVP